MWVEKLVTHFLFASPLLFLSSLWAACLVGQLLLGILGDVLPLGVSGGNLLQVKYLKPLWGHEPLTPLE